jgi:hypothetical protein
VTIEAGVLSLRITEQGADQVLTKLGQIDAKARALGKATQSVQFNTASATGVNGQLGQMSLNLTRVGQAATAATPAVQQHARAQQQMGAQMAVAERSTNSLTSAIGRHLLVYLSFGAATRAYDAVAGAADRQETAQRKLSATARLTGQSLATITAISQNAQSKFAVSSSAAADLTQNFVKLAGRTGNVAQTGQLMTAWMDLAAAQGLSLSDVMTGVNSTLMGQDEGLNRIGLQNPSNIWKQWADAAGTTVAKMTDQEKWQAIVNAVTAEGAKVQGEYARFLETTAGKQQAFNAALEATSSLFGKSIAPAREWAYEVGTAVLSVLRAFMSVDDTLSGLPQKFKLLGLMVTNPGGFAAEVLKLNSPSTFTRQGPPIAGMGSPKAKAPAAPTAEEKAAAKEAAETIAKALALDLDQIPLADITAGERIQKPGLVGVDKDGKMKGIAAAVGKQLDAVGTVISEKKKFLTGLMEDVGHSLTGALAGAFMSAFKGEGNFFEEFGKGLLSSLGNILVQLGAQMVIYGAIMGPLGLIPGPWQVLGMGAAASAAAGVALMALGAGMGAIGGGGKSGGGGGSSDRAPVVKEEQDEFSVAFDPDRKLRKSSSAVQGRSRGLSNAPMPDGRPVVQIGTLNALHPDDPKWQRAVADTYNNARNRGLVRNG